MLTLPQIEAAIVFLDRAQLQGAEVRVFVDLTNALHAQRAQLLLAANARETPVLQLVPQTDPVAAPAPAAEAPPTTSVPEQEVIDVA